MTSKPIELGAESAKGSLPARRELEPPLSVLVVDDSLPMRAHLRTVLKQEPGLCLAAESDTGADALALFFRFRPDVVLLDVCLPDASGFDILQTIKQADPRCAVILLSDSIDPWVDEVSQLLGATIVCHKASELNRIREVLRRLAQDRALVGD